MDNNYYVHPRATLIGDNTIGEDCSIWPGAVLRADMNPIRLGRAVNIQDNSVLHVDSFQGINIGDYTLVGHTVVLHSCNIGRGCLIGNGAIVLEGVEIGDGSLISAGTQVGSRRRIPPHSLVFMKNGELVIKEQKSVVKKIIAGSIQYVNLGRRMKENIFGPFTKEELKSFDIEAEKIAKEMGLI